MYKDSRRHPDWPNLSHMSNCANPFGWMLGIWDWPDGSSCLRLMLWSQEREGEMLPRQMHRCASHTGSQCRLPDSSSLPFCHWVWTWWLEKACPEARAVERLQGGMWKTVVWLTSVWALKNWCFWTVVLENTLESPLHTKEIKPVHPKGNQFWIFIGRTDAEAEAPMLWPPDAKNWLIGKDPDAGKDWRQEAKGRTEDEMVGWHHWLSGHEFEQPPGVGDRQESLACYSPWSCKELNMTELLNWTEYLVGIISCEFECLLRMVREESQILGLGTVQLFKSWGWRGFKNKSREIGQ